MSFLGKGQDFFRDNMGLSGKARQALRRPADERRATLIDLAAMLDREHENVDYFILDRADCLPVPNAILPEFSRL
jgi:hypothetical protein